MPIANDGGNPPKSMKYFFVRFVRKSTGSQITLVAALDVRGPRKTLNRLLEHKWVGWEWEIIETDRKVFESKCFQTNRVKQTDWDKPRKNVWFEYNADCCGNLFDPEWFV